LIFTSHNKTIISKIFAPKPDKGVHLGAVVSIIVGAVHGSVPHDHNPGNRVPIVVGSGQVCGDPLALAVYVTLVL